MKPEEINFEIGRICGWFNTASPPYNDWRHESHASHNTWTGLPDYHGSLDAMHEVEKVLNAGQINTYLGYLYRNTKVANKESNPWEIIAARVAIHATASQRAEAFLRVFGKWVEAGIKEGAE